MTSPPCHQAAYQAPPSPPCKSVVETSAIMHNGEISKVEKKSQETEQTSKAEKENQRTPTLTKQPNVHLDCEAKIAKFLGTHDSILYSYGLSTMSVQIPAFCKKGDLVIVLESNTFGYLANLVRTKTEHYKVPIDKKIYNYSIWDIPIATEGGFLQRNLSSSVMSSLRPLPPTWQLHCKYYAIDVIRHNHPQLLVKLRDNVKILWTGFLCLYKNDLIRRTLQNHVLKEHSVFVVTSKRSLLDKCKLPVGIRLFVSAAHTESDLQKAYESLKVVAASVLTGQY
ncbi:long chain base biosynthesis protein 1-like protein [Tanacetum coccineum]